MFKTAMRLNTQPDGLFNLYCPKRYALLVTEGLRVLKIAPLVIMADGNNILANKDMVTMLFDSLVRRRELNHEGVIFPLANVQEISLVGAGLAKVATHRSYLLTAHPERVVYGQTLDAMIAAAEGASLLLPGVLVPAVKPVSPE